LKEALLKASSASVAGALAKLGIRNVWIRGAAPIVGGGARAVGEAFTMRFLPAREDLVGKALAALPNSRAAVEAMEDGSIAVIETGGVTDAGFAGVVLCTRMVQRGSAGLVTDGAVRDIAGVEQSGLPVWSRGTASPAPGNSLTFIGWGMPIACGGVTVFPGDVIIADRDGAVVIPQALIEQVTTEASEVELFDAWVVSKVEAGEPLPGLYPPNDENQVRYAREAAL
jgi:regulator of RNase E activity RraA